MNKKIFYQLLIFICFIAIIENVINLFQSKKNDVPMYLIPITSLFLVLYFIKKHK